jgi:hypothetical protein
MCTSGNCGSSLNYQKQLWNVRQSLLVISLKANASHITQLVLYFEGKKDGPQGELDKAPSLESASHMQIRLFFQTSGIGYGGRTQVIAPKS